MQTLPIELQYEIYRYLPIRDLYSLRQTSKYFADIDLDYLSVKVVDGLTTYKTIHGIKHGLYERLSDGTNGSARYHYRNGILHGLSEEYYWNGQIYNRYYCKNGYIHNIYEEWFDDGVVSSVFLFKKGHLIEKYYEWQ